MGKIISTIRLTKDNHDIAQPVSISFNVYTDGDVELGYTLDKSAPYSTGDSIIFTFTIRNHLSIAIPNTQFSATINNSISSIEYSIDGGSKSPSSSNDLSIEFANLKAGNTIVSVYGTVDK